LRDIENLDVKDDSNDLELNERLSRMKLFSQLRTTEKKLESIGRQKSRVKWFKYGDSNSKFFHSAIRWRRRKNEIKGVEVDNQWCEESEVVRREAMKLFPRRFTAIQDIRVSLGSVEFKTLPEEVSLGMTSCFTEEEVKEAVWQCEGSKSPSPDGFNFIFIKNSWDILKLDILAVVLAFQETG